MNTFRPVEIKDYYINRVAKAMSQYFYKHIFEKIFEVLQSQNVTNTKDALLEAIKNGKVYYKDGAFRAERFTNAVSLKLEELGATFRNGSYYIQQSLIPLQYIQAIGIVQASTASKLVTIQKILSTIEQHDLDLDKYLLATVEQMFKSLEVDIVKSAEQYKVPVIELGIVTPKAKLPKAKKLEDYWKETDKKLTELRKQKKKAETPEQKANIQQKIDSLTKDAFQNAPTLDVQIDEIELTDQSRKIAEDYTYNMKYWIKKWETKNIVKMRRDVMEMVQKGARQPEIQAYFEKQWGKAGYKAKFLAENESHLAGSVIKQTEYQKLGCTKFKWLRSTSKEKRKDHMKYYGEVFDFANPPIIDEKLGITGLPRQIWNCKCQMAIVPPSMDELINKVQNSKSLMGKINGFFNSSKCNNNTWRYRRFGQGQTF